MDGSTSGTSEQDLRALVRGRLTAGKLSQSAAAREVGISASTLSQWLNDSYPGDVAEVEVKVARWLRAQQARASTMDMLPAAPGWVETPLARQVYGTLSWAQVCGDIVVCFGAAGLGKTVTAARYRDENPSVWVATMTPASAQVVTALTEIAIALGVEALGGGAAALHRAICRKLRNTRGLLIIDEAQHLGIPALDQIRSIHDACEIGVAYVGNEGLYTQMSTGRHSTSLDRLFSRIGKRAKLPKAGARDVDLLASAWGVPAGECRRQLQAIAAKPGALRGLAKVLRRASAYAAAAQRAICCEDVGAAWAEIGGDL